MRILHLIKSHLKLKKTAKHYAFGGEEEKRKLDPTKCVAVTLSAVVVIGTIFILSFQASASPSSQRPVLTNHRYLDFRNSVTTVHAGNPCLNILGYFVTICDKNDKPLGMAFTTVPTISDSSGERKSVSNLETGRAGYTTKDPNTGRWLDDNTAQVVDLKDRTFQNELFNYSGANAKKYLNAMLSNQKEGYVNIEELLCTARSTGSGVSQHIGWVNTTLGTTGHSDGTHYPINTQVALLKPNPSTADVIHDLSILNYHYSVKKALSVRSRLKVLRINASAIVASKYTSDSACISACHYGFGGGDSLDLFGGGYDGKYGTFKNLNVSSFLYAWMGGNQIDEEGYTPFLSIHIGKSTPPLPPTPSVPTTVNPSESGGQIWTGVTGVNDNFNEETSTFYSGQLGHFRYKYRNDSFCIERKVNHFPLPDTKPVEYINFLAEIRQPSFTLHGTATQSKVIHQEYNGSTFTTVQKPTVNSIWNASLWAVDRGSNRDEQYQKLPSNPTETSETSSSFRVNYNSYMLYYNSAGEKVVPARSAMWDTENKTYATAIGTVKIVPSDVEAYDIKLLDATTRAEVDIPYVGEYLIPVYYYKNNTSINVTAVGHGDSTESKFLDGHKDEFTTPFAIGTDSCTTKEGAVFRILKKGNQSAESFTLSCSVWLDNFDHDASWESNQKNNEFSKTFHVKDPLTGYFIEPNSNYREDTDVISSFVILNQTGYDMDNSQAINPILTVTYEVNGQQQSQTVRSSTNMVSPALDESMVWFKWHVPKGARGKAIFSVQIDPEKAFIDMDPWDDPKIYGEWTINPAIVCETPDTAFAETPAKWYNIFANKLDMKQSRVTKQIWPQKTWTVWRQNGSFYRQTYTTQIPTTFTSYIEPHGSPTSVWTNNKWYMKSGYGFTITTTANTVKPGDGVTYKDYTNVQNCYVLFPEFMYDCKIGQSEAKSYFNGRYGFKQPSTINWIDSVANSKYATDQGTYGTFTALRRTAHGGFAFPLNSAMMDFVHYTPDWEPDSSYRVKNYAYDAWTPAGMLSFYSNSNEIRIRGTMYSDYYVAGN